MTPFVERRRFPRVSNPAIDTTFVLSFPARVADVSRSGALLAASQPVEAGCTARFEATIDGNRISAEIEVRHVSPARHQDGLFRLGTSILSLAEPARSLLDEFLKQRR